MSTLETDVLADLAAADLELRLQAIRGFTLAETVYSVAVFERLVWLAKNDPSEDVRGAAEKALKSTRARMKVASLDRNASQLSAQLVTSMLITAETTERLRLLSVLQERDDRSLLPPIVEAIAWEPDDRVIAKMLSLIGRHGAPEHVAVVRKFLDHGDAKVLATALEAIGQLVDTAQPDLIEKLDQLSASHASPDVRFVTRRVAARLRGRDVAAPVEERLAAVGAIAQAGDRARAAALAPELARETDVRVLAKMVMVLKELGTPEHAEALKPLLKHADPRVCANAVEALAALGGEEVLPALFPLLAREDNRLRANLMLALYPRYPQQVMGYVGRMLRSDRVSFRVSGLYCAQFLDVGEMYPAVIELARTEKDAALFDALVDWVLKHGAPGRARRDLEDLATIRMDVSAAVTARLAKVSDAAPVQAPVEAVTDAPPKRSTAKYAIAPEPVGRTTASFPVQPPAPVIKRPTSKVPLPAAPPAPAERDWKKLALHPLSLLTMACLGLALTAIVAARRPDEAAALAAAQAKKHPVDRRAHRATVFKSPTKDEPGTVEIIMFGSPYRLKMDAPPGTPLVQGGTLWLINPRIVRAKDGSGWLAADQIATGDTPPVPEH